MPPKRSSKAKVAPPRDATDSLKSSATSCNPQALIAAVRAQVATGSFKNREAAGDYFDACESELKRAAPDLEPALLALQSEFLREIGDDVVLGAVSIKTKPPQKCLDLPIPFPEKEARALYEKGGASRVGVDSVGDVHDENKRRSREYLAESLALAEPLRSFAFPEDVERIRTTLCPAAKTIELRPYKLLLYDKGDFFTPHVDTMKDALQFGSLALEVPIVRATGGRSGAASKRRRAESDQASGSDDSSSPPSGEPGDLCFYCGRSVAADLKANDLPDDKARLIRLTPADAYFPEMGSDAEEGGDEEEEEDDEEATTLIVRLPMRELLAPKDVRGKLELNYAAWRGDVPHEVLPVKEGFRVMLIYRLFKVGEIPLRIPREAQLTAAANKAMHQLSVLKRQWERETLLRHCESATDAAWNWNLGIVLRHPYPPAGLTRAGLKGIDAVAFELLSRRWKCFLSPGYEVRDDDMNVPFRLNGGRFGAVVKVVFLTTDREAENSEDAFDLVCAKAPALLDCAWIQLGFGELTGGGCCFGNADCGTDWWYRHSVLLVTPEPSDWLRRRNAFLVGLHGSPAMRRLYGVADVFQHVVKYL